METALTHFQHYFEGDLFFDELHVAIYATDASVYRKRPIAVAFPKTEAGIAQLIDFAKEHKISLIPRAAGTSLAGQCVGEGIVVDISKYFTKIISVDPSAKTVTLQPGVIRDELNASLLPYGLFFGPNTSTSNRCMIGGMVGNNSSGTTSIQYGVTRDKVLRMKVFLSDGETAVFEPVSKEGFFKKASGKGLEAAIYRTIYNELAPETVQKEILEQFPKPEIHRRNTGYAIDSLLNTNVFGNASKQMNLCSLLCGSEGTLAFTTEVTLQLDNLPPAETIMIAAHYNSITDALQDVTLAMQHDLFTCELMDEVILDCTKNNKTYLPYRFFIEGAPKAVLLLELRAATEASLQEQVRALLSSLNSGTSYARPVLSGEEITMALELRKAGLGLLGNMVGDRKSVACIEDTAVALTDLSSFIGEFTAMMHRYGQQAIYYAHAGAGELHLRPILNLKKQQDVEFFRKITTEVALLTKKHKGSFSGEHGDGIVRSEFLPMLIGPANYALLQRIKTAFDPEGIFNPGKIVNANKMDTSLRYVPERVEPGFDTAMDFNDSGGILRLAEKCNGSGDCRKTEFAGGVMCPSYHATRNEKDTTRARANALREILTHSEAENKFDSETLKEAFGLCLSCKACASECPSNVDIATAKTEFQYQYHKANGATRADRFFGNSSRYNKMASRFPTISNWLFQKQFSASVIKRYTGIARERSLPHISMVSFSKRMQRKQYQEFKNYNVVLFIDEFLNYLEADIAEDAMELLLALGYRVRLVSDLDSARALISKGMLREAKKEVDTNIDYLKGIISEETPLIGIEPSAILGFRDEYLRLAENKMAAEAIAENTFLIEEFLASEIKKGKITAAAFTSNAKKVKIHTHCHQKALSNQKVTFDVLNLPENYTPSIIPSGCCGMAGSFGFEKEHFEVSMKIGELKLFPSVRKAADDTLVASNGTSCRHQVKDGTGKTALHPVTILRRALR